LLGCNNNLLGCNNNLLGCNNNLLGCNNNLLGCNNNLLGCRRHQRIDAVAHFKQNFGSISYKDPRRRRPTSLAALPQLSRPMRLLPHPATNSTNCEHNLARGRNSYSTPLHLLLYCGCGACRAASVSFLPLFQRDRHLICFHLERPSRF
jgi:hypothetical protein